MADLVISSAGIASVDAVVRVVQFAEASVPGDAVYLDTSSSNKWRLAKASGTVAQAGQSGVGIHLTTTKVDGDYGVVCTGGTIHLESDTPSIATGVTYCLSPTAGGGKIGLDSDVTAGNYKTILGVGGSESTNATTFDELLVEIVYTGQQV